MGLWERARGVLHDGGGGVQTVEMICKRGAYNVMYIYTRVTPTGHGLFGPRCLTSNWLLELSRAARVAF